jgi:O-antigen ligase
VERDLELGRFDRYGRALLLVVFVVLLSGRFTFGRLGALPDWDLRWPGLVLVALLLLAWTVGSRERRLVVGPGALLGWFVAWAAWMGISALWAPPGARVGEIALDLVFLVVFVAAGWTVAGRVHPRAVDAVWWWVYGAGWIYAAGAFAAGPDLQGRYAAFGGGPNVFVRVMALAVLATLFLAVLRRKHWVLVGLVPFLVGTYLSGSRGGVLALLVVVLVGGIPLLRRMSRETRTAIAVGGAVLALLLPFFYRPSWFGFVEHRFVEQTLEQGYDSQRLELFERSLDVFLHNIWFGAGLDSFYAREWRLTQLEYPHNLVLASLSEGGLVGGLLLVGALVAAGVALHRRRPLGAEALALGLAALFMLVAGMFSGDYYDSRFFWFFAGLAIIRARTAPAVATAEPRGTEAGKRAAPRSGAHAGH